MADINKQLRDVIEAVLREQFRDVTIETIKVERDTDEDGDDILRVQVIFNGQSKGVDAHKAASLLRYMRPKIAKIGEDAFPIVSFIAKSEWKNNSAAP